MARSKKDNINAQIFTQLKISELSGVPALIMSNPGMGKSTTVRLFAEIRGYKLQMLRGNSTTESEITGYDTVSESDINNANHVRPSWFKNILDNHEKGEPTLLFVDEITTANEYVQSAMLHIIFDRVVGDEEIPEDTLIVAAGNYSQNLSNSMTMLPPLMNRFMIVNLDPSTDDLDVFLNKYKGGILGKKSDKDLSSIKEELINIDKQEIEVSEELELKVGDLLEKGISETARYLTDNQKKHNFKISDLQNIYADSEDSLLRGFITFRTLNYLRDVAISYYKCFGINGLKCDNFYNSIEGLCGLGVSKDPKSGDIVFSPVAKEFFTFINTVSKEIEKLSNTSLPKYETFFKEFLVGKDSYMISDINAITNKITELKKDKEILDVECPIDSNFIEMINAAIIKTASGLCGDIKLSAGEDIKDKLTVETFMGVACTWNSIVKLVIELQDLVNNTRRGYKQRDKEVMAKAVSDIGIAGFRIRTIKKMFLKSDPAISSTIPTLLTI